MTLRAPDSLCDSSFQTPLAMRAMLTDGVAKAVQLAPLGASTQTRCALIFHADQTMSADHGARMDRSCGREERLHHAGQYLG